MTTHTIIYEPALDQDNHWYPKGPGRGLGYYGGYLYPETRCESEAEAERLCKFMNLAFQEGRFAKQREIQHALNGG